MRGERIQTHATKSGRKMAFRWPNIECLLFLGDPDQYSKESYSFVIFQGGIRTPCLPAPPPPLWISPWFYSCMFCVYGPMHRLNLHCLGLNLALWNRWRTSTGAKKTLLRRSSLPVCNRNCTCLRFLQNFELRYAALGHSFHSLDIGSKWIDASVAV